MAQWRRFSFFEKELVKDDNANQLSTELQALGITCTDGGRGRLIFGDNRGCITLLDRDMEMHRFRAYARIVTHIKQIKRWNVFVTVGDGIDPRGARAIAQTKAVSEAARKKLKKQGTEEPDTGPNLGEGNTAIVKVWRMDRQDRDGNPICIQEIKIFSKYPEEAVTAFAVMDDMSMMAVGLKNGAVILSKSSIRGGKDRRPQAPILLHPSAASPVTFVGFSGQSKRTGGSEKQVYLYVGTEKNLTAYQCSQDDDQRAPAPKTTILDERGVGRNCAAVNDAGEVAVGQEDAVYFFTPEDRGVCYGFDGEKRYTYFFKHYLLVVQLDPRGRHVVTVYDLTNKFIAFNFTLVTSSRLTIGDDLEQVSHISSEWGSIFITTSMGQIYRLTEKDTQSKLEMLYRKNLYAIAIPLAYSANVDIASIMDIFRMYGDHLYHKGDYDGAITQYIRTIGHVEPSYVIRKFLGAQRIQNLTTYLEALHEKALANGDHTTLLLNCYTKLKDVHKLNSFIGLTEDEVSRQGRSGSTIQTGHIPGLGQMSSVLTGPGGPGSLGDGADTRQAGAPKAGNDVKFDVETAISVLRATFPEHALFLAKKHSEHSWYLRIELEDIALNAHEGALSADDRRKVSQALTYIQSLSASEAEKYLRLYGKTLVTHLPEETTDVLKLLCTGKYRPRDLDTKQLLTVPQLTKPRPEDFISIYVDHQDYLRIFLEYYIQEEPRSSMVVGNTLLEILLLAWRQTFFVEGVPEEQLRQTRKEADEAVMSLLDSPHVSYDTDHALALLTMTDFRRGQLYLYSKVHMYHMVVRHYLESGNNRAALDEAKKHGEKDPSIWVQVLSYFADGKRKDNSKFVDDLKEVLHYIDQTGVLPALQVLQILSQSHDLPLSVVKNYIVSRLRKEEEVLTTDRQEIDQLRVDTEKMRREIVDLQSKAMVFQSTKCDLCKRDLDLPAVHFYCGHSFHQSCLPETDRECIQCAPEHRHVLDLKKSLERKADNHEQFFQQLETSGDGFKTVAEYFGRGVFLSRPSRQ